VALVGQQIEEALLVSWQGVGFQAFNLAREIRGGGQGRVQSPASMGPPPLELREAFFSMPRTALGYAGPPSPPTHLSGRAPRAERPVMLSSVKFLASALKRAGSSTICTSVSA